MRSHDNAINGIRTHWQQIWLLKCSNRCSKFLQTVFWNFRTCVVNVGPGYGQQWVWGDSMFACSQGRQVKVIAFELFFSSSSHLINFFPSFSHLIQVFFLSSSHSNWFIISFELLSFSQFYSNYFISFPFLKPPLTALSSLTSCWFGRIWRMREKTTG